ncbi:MAG TPA: hypothetical protein DCQ64_22265 [Candidatus Rokubacteria bacterium]|nr:hypothetical protein [Candidatus Rokubacteria bacterium]
MSLYDIVDVLQQMGKELKANAADAEAATKAVREYNAVEKESSSSSMPRAAGGVAGTMSASSGSGTPGGAMTAGTLTAAIQSLRGRTS